MVVFKLWGSKARSGSATGAAHPKQLCFTLAKVPDLQLLGTKKEKNLSYLIHADEIMSRAASRTLLPEYYLKCMKYVIISLSLLFCFNGLLEKWLDLPLRVGHNKTMAHETFIIVTASVMVSLLAISFCQ